MLSVMTASCAPVFNYFCVMSLPTFHCSIRKAACNSRRGGQRIEREGKDEIKLSRISNFKADSETA